MATPTNHASHATTEAHGGSGGTFPPFDPQMFGSQLLWLAIAFGALYVLMARVALPRVARILEDREGQVAGDLEAANKLKGQTDAAIAAYEKALADAKAKAQAIAGETRDKLAAQMDARRRALEADLAAKLEAADAQIAAGKAKAMTNVQAIAVEAAQAILTRLGGQAPAAGEVEAAIGRSLSPRQGA